MHALLTVVIVLHALFVDAANINLGPTKRYNQSIRIPRTLQDPETGLIRRKVTERLEDYHRRQTETCDAGLTACSGNTCCDGICCGDGCCPIGFDCHFVGNTPGCCPTGQTCSDTFDGCASSGYDVCPSQDFCCPSGVSCGRDASGSPQCGGVTITGGGAATGPDPATGDTSANAPTANNQSTDPPAVINTAVNSAPAANTPLGDTFSSTQTSSRPGSSPTSTTSTHGILGGLIGGAERKAQVQIGTSAILIASLGAIMI